MGRAQGQHVGYIRVSTLDQNTERQLDGIELAKVFTDKASGKDAKRPQLQATLNYLREGDTLSGIAARFGVSEEAILDENHRSDPNRLLVGEELIIPVAQP